MSWYAKESEDDEKSFRYIITKPDSIIDILSQNNNFIKVEIISKGKKDIILAKTIDGIVFKINNIHKISEDDDNYIINFSKYANQNF